MEGGEDPTLDKQYSQVDVFVRRSAVCQTGRELRSAPHCEVILSVNLDPAGFRRRGDELWRKNNQVQSWNGFSNSVS
jgi:hypothetical protein